MIDYANIWGPLDHSGRLKRPKPYGGSLSGLKLAQRSHSWSNFNFTYNSSVEKLHNMPIRYGDKFHAVSLYILISIFE